MLIDKPYIIDRETLKSLLQITGTTYDTLIDLYLPIVSEDVESICNNCFVKEYTGTLTSGSDIITDINIKSASKGWLISTSEYSQSILIDADIDKNTVTASDNATATAESQEIYINEFPIAKRVVASQMVAYQISKNKGINSSSKGAVKSKSLPPLSITYDDKDNSLSNGFGYPSYIVQSLKQITVPRFA